VSIWLGIRGLVGDDARTEDKRLCWGSSSIKICSLVYDKARTSGRNDVYRPRLDVLSKGVCARYEILHKPAAPVANSRSRARARMRF